MADVYRNENFPFPAVQELRRLGHNVMTVQESGLGGQSITDEDVLRFATRERRAVVTLNRRHFVRLHDEIASHAGSIICTVDNDFSALAGRIDSAIRECRELTERLLRVSRPG